MTPQEWITAMAQDVPWQKAYEVVRVQAAALLNHSVVAADGMSTTELVEALWPERYAPGAFIFQRRRVFKALMALASRGLAEYCTLGPPKLNRMRQTVRPKRWHSRLHSVVAAPLVQRCPHCGKEFSNGTNSTEA